MTIDQGPVDKYLKRVASELPHELAEDLGPMVSTEIWGWTLCVFAKENVFGGKYDAWSSTTLHLTTTGELVLRAIGWYGDTKERLDFLRSAEMEINALNNAYRSEDLPSNFNNGGDGGTIQSWGYTGERIFSEQFGGLQDLVESARIRLAAVDIVEHQAAAAAVASRVAEVAERAREAQLHADELEHARQREREMAFEAEQERKRREARLTELRRLRDRDAIAIFAGARAAFIEAATQGMPETPLARAWWKLAGRPGVYMSPEIWEEARFQAAIEYDAALAQDLSLWESSVAEVDIVECIAIDAFNKKRDWEIMMRGSSQSNKYERGIILHSALRAYEERIGR